MSKPEELEDGVTLREHTFDGIQEYDQKLPNWWLFTLYISIAFFVIAWVTYYQLPTNIPTDPERIEASIAAIEEKKSAQLSEMMASINDEALFDMSRESSHTSAGQGIFEAKCAACHGMDLSATMNGIPLPGVALIDEEWLYGSEPLSIMNIITNGSPDVTKGMIAWSGQLSPSEIAQVVAYILSKQSS